MKVPAMRIRSEQNLVLSDIRFPGYLWKREIQSLRPTAPPDDDAGDDEADFHGEADDDDEADVHDDDDDDDDEEDDVKAWDSVTSTSVTTRSTPFNRIALCVTNNVFVLFIFGIGLDCIWPHREGWHDSRDKYWSRVLLKQGGGQYKWETISFSFYILSHPLHFALRNDSACTAWFAMLHLFQPPLHTSPCIPWSIFKWATQAETYFEISDSVSCLSTTTMGLSWDLPGVANHAYNPVIAPYF